MNFDFPPPSSFHSVVAPFPAVSGKGSGRGGGEGSTVKFEGIRMFLAVNLIRAARGIKSSGDSRGGNFHPRARATWKGISHPRERERERAAVPAGRSTSALKCTSSGLDFQVSSVHKSFVYRSKGFPGDDTSERPCRRLRRMEVSRLFRVFPRVLSKCRRARVY